MHAALVLHAVDLWPFRKASLIAFAAACFWHFNIFWALALPLTSVTGIKVHIPSKVLLGYALAECLTFCPYALSFQHAEQHAVRVHTANWHRSSESARDHPKGRISVGLYGAFSARFDDILIRWATWRAF